MIGFGIYEGWIRMSNTEVSFDHQLNDHSGIDDAVVLQQLSSYPKAFVLGSLIGSAFSGFITMKFGRKIPLLFMSIPLIVSIR